MAARRIRSRTMAAASGFAVVGALVCALGWIRCGGGIEPVDSGPDGGLDGGAADSGADAIGRCYFDARDPSGWRVCEDGCDRGWFCATGVPGESKGCNRAWCDGSLSCGCLLALCPDAGWKDHTFCLVEKTCVEQSSGCFLLACRYRWLLYSNDCQDS